MKRTFVSMLVLCVIVGITMLFFSCDSSLISSQDKTGAVTIRTWPDKNDSTGRFQSIKN